MCAGTARHGSEPELPARLEIDRLDADTSCMMREVLADSESQPLWSAGDKVILGLIALVMLASSAGVFLGLIH